MITPSCQRWAGKIFTALVICCVLSLTLLSGAVSLNDIAGNWGTEVILPGGTRVQSFKTVNQKGEYVEYLTNYVDGWKRTAVVAGVLCVSNNWLVDTITNDAYGNTIPKPGGILRIVSFSHERLSLASPNGSNRIDYLRDTNDFIPPRISAALQKAKEIKLSSVKFDSLSLAVTIAMLQDESVKRDKNRKGITISIGPDEKQLADAEVNLDLKDVTLAEAIARVADSVGLEMQAIDTEILLVRKKAKQ